MIPGAALGLAVAVAVGSNLDNLGAGLAHGVAGRPIGVGPNVVVALLAAATTAASVTLGQLGSRAAPAVLAARLGGVLLVAIGLATGWGALRRGAAGRADRSQRAAASAGPTSSPVNLVEALVLGLGLSLNNLVEGLGAGAAGASVPLTTALSAALSLVCVGAGGRVGHHGARVLGRVGPLLAAVVFVVLGMRLWL